MANIRIKDLSTTAASTASDDFIAVDGATNGTRKLDAYSPTFGGNLTVSGGTIGTAASTNLTLAGGSSGASLALGQGTTGTFTFTLPSISAGSTTWVSAGATGIGIDFKRATATATLGGTLASLNGYNGATRSTIFEFNGDGATDSGRFDWWVKPTAGSLTQAMVLKSNGNLLIGTTTDGGQKLQVNGTIAIGANVWHTSLSDSKNRFYFIGGGASNYAGAGTGDNHVFQNSAGSTILALDNSLNATFAGSVVFAVGKWQKSSESKQRLYFEDNSITYVKGGKSDSTGNAIVLRNIADDDVLTISNTSAKTATFAGAIAIGNTVNTVSPTSPNRTITMVIGGTTYYIHAKTTND